jgi:parallel beta-helix repeat protein
MRKRYTSVVNRAALLVSALLLTVLHVAAQVDIPIGTGSAGNTGSTFPSPIQDYYEGSRAQYLYKASELSAAGMSVGTITAIKFNVTALNVYGGTVQEYTMKIGTTASSTLGTVSTSWEAGTTTVYGPVDYTVTSGVNTFTFATPFFWNGSDNIVVEVCNGLATNATGTHYTENITVPWTTGLSFNGSHTIAADDAGNLCGATIAGAAITTTATTRPNIVFAWTLASGCTGKPEAGDATSSTPTICPNQNFFVSLSGATLAAGLTYKWQSSLNNTTWSDIASATGSTLATSQPVSSWYRAIVTCTNGGLSDTATSFKVSSPALVSGTYTINNALPTGGLNFQTFTDAVNFISCGINGPVVFRVSPGSGPYNEQVTIPSIGGTSNANTVTFKGNLTTLSFNSTITSARAGILLNGADHVIIDSLIISGAAGTYGWGVVITNQADSNRISNCQILVSTTSNTATNHAGIVINGSATGTGSSGNNGNGNVFTGNTITGGYYGIYLYGSSTAGAQNLNNVVSNNTITDTYSYGIMLTYQSGAVVSKNDVSRPTKTASTTTAGVYVTTGCINTLVEKNTVHNMFDALSTNTSTSYGVYVGADGTAGNENKVINNLIYNIGGNGIVYGIYNTSGDYMQVYHNTVSLDDVAATTGAAYGLYQTTAATGLVYKNNLVSVTRSGTGVKRAVYFVTTTSTITSNNNVLYMNSSAGTDNKIGQFGTTSYTALTDWQTANTNAYDQQSLSVDPQFISPPNYAPSNAQVNNIGANVGVTTDILGTARLVASPDPGAYEISLNGCTNPPTPGTAVVSVTPVCPNASFTLNLTNNSIGDGQTYQWQSSPNNTTWTNIGAATTATAYTTSQTVNTYYRAGVKCNSGTIVYSASVYVVSPSLVSGTYTINNALPTGSGNFQTFTDAISFIRCGVNGPVVFNVATNTYSEQVTIPIIAGTSVTNTVTIKGNGSTLSYNSSDVNSRTAFVLNGADHIILDSLTIDVASGTYGWGILLTNQADSNVIRKCTILNNTSSTLTNYMGILINGAGNSTAVAGNNGNYNLITGNTITGGYYGLYAYGNTTPYNKGNVFSNNLVQEMYGYGLYAYGQDSIAISGNEITRPSRSVVTTTYGIYISTNTNVVVEKNRVHNLFDAATTSTSSAYPLYIGASGTISAVNRLENNLVYNINNGAGIVYGIYGSAASYWNVYHNTVVLDDAAATTGTTYGCSSYGTGVNVRNNIIYVSRGGSGTKYCLYYGTGPIASSNNNILYMNSPSGTNYIGYYSVGVTTFADWQAANSAAFDQQSLNADPAFTYAGGPGDFTPGASSVGDLAAPVGVLTDITGKVRSISTPDAGAFEFTAPACTSSNGGNISSATTSICGSGAVAFTGAGYANGSQITYQWQSSTDNFVSNINDISAAVSPLGYNTGTISSTTSYRLKVTCAATTTTGYSNVVKLTVSPLPTVSITPLTPAAVCAPSAITLNLGATSAASPIYQWQVGGADVSGANATSYQAGISGSYRLKVTNGVTLCSGNSAPAIVTINPVPTAMTITPSTPAVCSTAQQLTASGGLITGATIMADDFNGSAPGWTIINNSVGTAAPTTWMFQPDGYVYNATYPTAYHSNDNSQFIHLNCDPGGTGSTTSAILQSPPFSTVGFNTASLSFYQFYQVWATGDVAVAVEVSTNGSTWTALQNYVGTAQGAYANFLASTINLNAYINQSTVYIRFRFQSNWGYWWALDNVSVTGDQATTIKWSPTTGLFTDAAATAAYTGGAATSVYAKPAVTTVYTATASSLANCSKTQAVTVTQNCVTPVTLVSFKGDRVGAINKLDWTTATEINNTGFELQRSADGRTFSKLTFVASKATNGNSVLNINYNFDDIKPLLGNGYYRLKQIDRDGKSTLSNVVLIKGAKVNTLMITSIYPNPVKEQLNMVVESPGAESVNLVVTDVTGKIVKEQAAKLVAGDNQLKVNVLNLSSGTYIIKAVCENGCESAVQKFVKH